MTQDEFPDDLIRHCEQKALEAVAADTSGLVRAVLRASGYAELVAALEEARKFVVYERQYKGIQHARELGELLERIDDALAAAGHKQGGGE